MAVYRKERSQCAIWLNMSELACWLWGLRPDDKDTNATAQGSVAESNATGNPVNLLDGKLSFSLPADMTDQSGKLGTQANNMHVWSDATGQKAVIVIMGDDPKKIWRCWRSVWKISNGRDPAAASGNQ